MLDHGPDRLDWNHGGVLLQSRERIDIGLRQHVRAGAKVAELDESRPQRDQRLCEIRGRICFLGTPFKSAERQVFAPQSPPDRG